MDLDRFIAEKAMNKPWIKPNHGPCCTCQTCGHDHDDCQCGYTEDIGMAFEVVERMRELKYTFNCHWSHNGNCVVKFHPFGSFLKSGKASDKEIAKAICLAAKAALEDK